MFAPWLWVTIFFMGEPAGLELQNAEEAPICVASEGADPADLALIQGAPDVVTIAETLMGPVLGSFPLYYECMRHALILAGREQWRGEEEIITREQMENCGLTFPEEE